MIMNPMQMQAQALRNVQALYNPKPRQNVQRLRGSDIPMPDTMPRPYGPQQAPAGSIPVMDTTPQPYRGATDPGAAGWGNVAAGAVPAGAGYAPQPGPAPAPRMPGGPRMPAPFPGGPLTPQGPRRY